jgi:hypothetical protein
MEEAAQPTAPACGCGRGHNVLSKHAPDSEKYQNVQNGSLHERVKTDPKAFEVAKTLSNPLSNRHENSLCIRVLPRFRRGWKPGKATTLHVPSARTSKPSGYGGIRDICPRPSVRKNSGNRKDSVDFGARRHSIFFLSAANGTYGALFQLDEHGRVVLDTLSVERRGSLLFVFINGRPITELEIDKRVSDGKIYIPSGLTSEDIEVMKKDWHMIGQRKR